MTVRRRIMLLIVGTGLVSGFLFSGVVFYEFVEQSFRLLDSMLEEEAYKVIELLEHEKGQPNLHIDEGYWIVIYDRQSSKVIFRSKLADFVRLPSVKPSSAVTIRDVVVNDASGKSKVEAFRLRAFPVFLGDKDYIVQVGRSLGKVEEEIRELVWGIPLGLIFSVLILILISHFVTGKILKPIGQMKDLARDISEKNLEQRLPVNEQGDEFNELAMTINQMLDRLQYSFMRQRNFLFDTSHELKTPLATIRLAIGEISSSDMDSLSPSIRDNLLRLNNQVLRMERLVKDLLDMSSLETLSGLDLKPVHLTELLSALIEDYQLLSDARSIMMEVNLPENLWVKGDEEKLRRAFSNLLDNAIKYNEDGGQIVIRAEREVAETAVIVVIIENTGPGVPEEDLPKVFDQFYRVEKSRSLDYGGSGLGLSIVKRIIELHKGKVDIESKPGVRTRVIVRMPGYNTR